MKFHYIFILFTIFYYILDYVSNATGHVLQASMMYTIQELIWIVFPGFLCSLSHMKQ